MGAKMFIGSQFMVYKIGKNLGSKPAIYKSSIAAPDLDRHYCEILNLNERFISDIYKVFMTS